MSSLCSTASRTTAAPGIPFLCLLCFHFCLFHFHVFVRSEIFFYFGFILCVMGVLPVHMSVYLIHAISVEARKGHQLPLEPELEVVVSHDMGAVNKGKVLWKTLIQCS